MVTFRDKLRTVALELDTLVVNYADARDKWCPFGPSEGPIIDILGGMANYLNERPQLPHRKQLSGIRLQSYSEAFFAPDYDQRQETYRRLSDIRQSSSQHPGSCALLVNAS